MAFWPFPLRIRKYIWSIGHFAFWRLASFTDPHPLSENGSQLRSSGEFTRPFLFFCEEKSSLRVRVLCHRKSYVSGRLFCYSSVCVRLFFSDGDCVMTNPGSMEEQCSDLEDGEIPLEEGEIQEGFLEAVDSDDDRSIVNTNDSWLKIDGLGECLLRPTTYRSTRPSLLTDRLLYLQNTLCCRVCPED